MLSRRQWVLSLSALAACRPLRDAGVTPEGPTPAPECGVEFEAVTGVDFTDSEWSQLQATLDEQLALAGEIRGHRFEHGLAPATLFDPRLPGFTPPPTTSTRWPDAAPHPPADDEALAFSSCIDQAHWIATGQLTSRRLTEVYLARLQHLDPGLQAVITPMGESALAQADRADAELAAGRHRGPLHGLVWGAKDLIDTAGVATTWGAAPYRSRVPTSSAEVVRRLDEAGAVLLAKLSTGALAYGDIWFDGVTRNPWNLHEGSSGSSAGSASAVAAGLVSFALGTETLGSIVSPCARCGATGLRPTFGRVPRSGVMALCWSLDKVGPIARRVADTMLVLQALAGAHDGDPASVTLPLAFDAKADLSGLRIGVYRKAFDAGTEHDRAALAAARTLGARIVELPPLSTPPASAIMVVLFAEAAASFVELTRSDRDDELTWQEPEAWPNTFRRAQLVPAVDFIRAQQIRREIMQTLDRAWADVDVVLTPNNADRLLTLTNATGHPCVVLPAGFSARLPAKSLDWPDGVPQQSADPDVPHGITVIGRLFDEGRLVRIAHALEGALAVHGRHPPLW